MKKHIVSAIIGALLVALTFFLFRNEWSHLLRNTKTFKILGIEIEVDQTSADDLEPQIAEYEGNIASLSNRSLRQDSIIAEMSGHMTNLLQQISDCNQASASANTVRKDIKEASVLSRDIRVQADVLKDVKILRKFGM